MQVDPNGDEGDSLPRANDPPEEKAFYGIRSGGDPSTPLSEMLNGRVGRPESVGSKEDPSRMGKEEEE